MPQQRIPHAPISVAHAHLGLAARQLRAERGVSQEELGFRAGLHRNYIGAIERGEINPTFSTLLKLCRGLGIRLARLIAIAERSALNAQRQADEQSQVPSPSPGGLVGSIHENAAS